MSIHELQHRLTADRRDYVIEVCAPGHHPAPISAGPFDVHILADVPANFADYENEEPESIVRHVLDYVRPLIPATTPPELLGQFSDKVLAWVCQQRAAAARNDFNAEWRSMRPDGQDEE